MADSAVAELAATVGGAVDRRLIRSAFAEARPGFARPFTRWVEEEIYLPPSSRLRPGLLYSYEEMPCKRLLHEAMDDPRWERCYWSGPSQVSGKTLDLTSRLLYSLFELRQDCGLAGPDVDMVQNVIWNPKIRPVLMASRYADLLPTRGQGSRGGKFRAIEFRNGTTLFFLGFGGSDSQRTSVTFRNAFLTELDQARVRSKASIESSPALSIMDRVRSWGELSRIYGECVNHTVHDLIWQETETTADGKPTGSGGRVFIRCPHCGRWFWPAREGLVGWQEAASELEARAKAAYPCPECGVVLSEADRRAANAVPRLVHRGQAVEGEAGRVVGELPPTRTLGFRTNPMHSPMTSVAELAALEWRAARSEGEDEARNVCNNVWNEPWDPEAESGGAGRELTANFVREKVGPCEHRVVPAAAEVLTLGVDVGLYLCSWMAPAWRKDAAGWLVDAGEIAVPREARSPELAVEAALSEFLAVARDGWPREEVAEVPGVPSVSASPVVPALVLIDSGFWPEVVHRVCREFAGKGLRVLPCKGWGSTGRRSPFHAPKPGGGHELGNEWFISRQPDGMMLVNVNVDHWKRWVQARLSTPAVSAGAPHSSDSSNGSDGLQPGSLVLWKPTARMEHQSTAKSMVSEVWREYIHKTKGLVSGWKVQSPSRTHRLDALGYAACAADICGVKLLAPPPAPPARADYPASRPEGKSPGWKIGR